MAGRNKAARTVFAIVLRAAWMLSTSASASAETWEERQACIGDAFHFCSSEIPDRDRVFSCLVENRDGISAACHAVMAASLPVAQASSQIQLPRNASASKRPLNILSH